jgi:hypothetical protein
MKLDSSSLVACAEGRPAPGLVPVGIAPGTYAAAHTRRDGKVVSVGPVTAAGLAELPFPSRVRSSHLAEQNQVILLWKARNVVKGEWAVL